LSDNFCDCANKCCSRKRLPETLRIYCSVDRKVESVLGILAANNNIGVDELAGKILKKYTQSLEKKNNAVS
jgi:hypothetical protein